MQEKRCILPTPRRKTRYVNLHTARIRRLDVYNTTECSNTMRLNKKYDFAAALSGGRWLRKLDGIRQFKLIFNPKTEAYKEVGGFLTILQQYERAWEWRHFWELQPLVSCLGSWIFYLSCTDGGYVVFTVIEMITGNKPSIKVLEIAQMIGSSSTCFTHFQTETT